MRHAVGWFELPARLSMADDIFEHPRLAAICDALDPERTSEFAERGSSTEYERALALSEAEREPRFLERRIAEVSD
jgi:hypothetical protein